MANIQSFEEIGAWKKARVLSRAIYRATSEKEFARDWGLKDQIRRASVSILSNIAEGFERSSPKEFRHFLYIAKGSAGEVRAQLYVALDAGYISQEEFNYLYTLTGDTLKLLGGFIRYLDSPTRPNRSQLATRNSQLVTKQDPPTDGRS